MPYRPKLDPKVDLAGATAETLVQALFRRTPLRPRPGGESDPATTKEQARLPAEQASRVLLRRK